MKYGSYFCYLEEERVVNLTTGYLIAILFWTSSCMKELDGFTQVLKLWTNNWRCRLNWCV